MNREDVYKMAEESDLGFLLGDNWMMQHELVCFATLVAAHEREQFAKQFAKQAVDIARRAIEVEREACAKVCANLMIPWDETTANSHVIALKNDGMRQCAVAIRARGQA